METADLEASVTPGRSCSMSRIRAPQLSTETVGGERRLHVVREDRLFRFQDGIPRRGSGRGFPYRFLSTLVPRSLSLG